MRLLKKYLITLGVEAVAVFFILLLKDIFTQTDPKMIFHILCDAFFAVGVVATGFGLLVFGSNEGVFDGLAFAVGAFVNMFKKSADKKYHNLYDYKASRGNKKIGFGFLLICGLIFLAISMIMYFLYRKYA